MRLQIKDAGAWRNLVAFTTDRETEVMQAAADLLVALNQPNTVMRVAESDTALFYCRAPDYLWVAA